MLARGLEAVGLDRQVLAGRSHRPWEGRRFALGDGPAVRPDLVHQTKVDGKTNEHKTALGLLRGLVLQGRVVTGIASWWSKTIRPAFAGHSRDVHPGGGCRFFPLASVDAPRSSSVSTEARRNEAAGSKSAGSRQPTCSTSTWTGRPPVRSARSNEPSHAPTANRATSWTMPSPACPQRRVRRPRYRTWWRGHWGIENRSYYVCE